MDEIVEIIAKRDSIDEDQARQIVENAIAICRNLLLTADPFSVEEAWTEETGLEPDYLYNVLYF